MYMWNICLFTHVVSQNYAYFRIQWFFHEQLIQNSMIFCMIFSFLQISRTFHEIHWFFHDLETDLNFNDFSRAVGTLLKYPVISSHNIDYVKWGCDCPVNSINSNILIARNDITLKFWVLYHSLLSKCYGLSNVSNTWLCFHTKFLI